MSIATQLRPAQCHVDIANDNLHFNYSYYQCNIAIAFYYIEFWGPFSIEMGHVLIVHDFQNGDF